MRIALLAPIWKKVPPEKYGGSELIVANLTKGLANLGHEVTTFACGGSKPSGKLISVIPKPMYDIIGGFNWNGIQPYEFLSFFELGKHIKNFDIVHNHMGLHPIAFAPLLPIPMITTLHSSLPPDFPSLAEAFRKYPFVSISNAQRKVAPKLNYVATVSHGIDTESFKPRLNGKGNGFVFLGTLSKNKGIDIAVRTAHKLGIKLTIAGEVRESDRPFLDKEVFPLVNGKNIRFIGEIGHKEKNRLLSKADALLFPTQWNEAFGLVMAESLACGTPVIALGNGAVPEVLSDGVTGFIAKNEASFINAAKNAGKLSRNICRKTAEKRFSIPSMATGYLKVYNSLIDKKA